MRIRFFQPVTVYDTLEPQRPQVTVCLILDKHVALIPQKGDFLFPNQTSFKVDNVRAVLYDDGVPKNAIVADIWGEDRTYGLRHDDITTKEYLDQIIEPFIRDGWKTYKGK